MIENVIYEKIKTELQDVSVYLEVPEAPTKDYITLMVTGIRKEAPNLYSGLLTVQSYSDSMYKTALLNERVIDAVGRLIELNTVTKCKLNSSGLLNNLKTKEYKYNAVFDITFYRS